MKGTSNSSRRNAIVELVNQRGYMQVEDLCAILDVTPATIRTDLDALDELSQLIRLRGVALSNRYSPDERRHAMSGDNSAAIMSNRMSDEKRLIARLCMGQIKANDTVFLDTSNTNLVLASAMVVEKDKPLTVITNSVDIFHVLRHGSHISTLVTGGDYETVTNSFVGSLAVQFLTNFKAHHAFITARGFHVVHGVRVYHSQNTQVRQAMLNNAGNCIVVADNSKFNLSGVEILCNWNKVHTLITDAQPPERFTPVFKEHNINIIIPDPDDILTIAEEGLMCPMP